MTDRYSMIIRWSEQDRVFIVSLPEFGSGAQTHGDTYEEAVKNGREVLDLLIESFQAEGRAIPAPRLYEGSRLQSASRNTVSYLTADEALLERLAGIMAPVEVRDPNGRVLGRYTPEFSDEPERSERAAKYFDLAEAERTLVEEKNQGNSLADVWKRIHAGEIPG